MAHGDPKELVDDLGLKIVVLDALNAMLKIEVKKGQRLSREKPAQCLIQTGSGKSAILAESDPKELRCVLELQNVLLDALSVILRTKLRKM